jgi:hypothetical protein
MQGVYPYHLHMSLAVVLHKVIGLPSKAKGSQLKKDALVRGVVCIYMGWPRRMETSMPRLLLKLSSPILMSR